MRPILSFIALSLLLPSCFVSRDRINEPLSPALITELEPGVSDADDVLEALGAPADMVQLGHRSAWLYLFTQSKSAAFSVFVVWPLKVRVGANSPSLWPTMFSVTYTGMNFFPL